MGDTTYEQEFTISESYGVGHKYVADMTVTPCETGWQISGTVKAFLPVERAHDSIQFTAHATRLPNALTSRWYYTGSYDLYDLYRLDWIIVGGRQYDRLGHEERYLETIAEWAAFWAYEYCVDGESFTLAHQPATRTADRTTV